MVDRLPSPDLARVGRAEHNGAADRLRRPSPTRGRCPWMLLLTVLFGLSACGPSGRFIAPPPLDGVRPPPDSARGYTVFLIGDAGSPRRDRPEPTLSLLRQMLEAAGPAAAVVFLGDNIYPSGLPSTLSPGRPEAERRLTAQLEVVEPFDGQVVFIPGNHDWGNYGLGGDLATLRRQELFVESALDRGNTFLPDDGFPGPVEVPLNDRLVLIVLDTQWWLESLKTYGDTGQYQLEQEGSVLIELDDILKRNADKDILVVGHHPIFTNGEHGGFFGEARDYLPVPLMRRYLGTPQDVSNLRYRTMRNGLLAVFRQHENLVYAAGHDHNLQHFRSGAQHYLVSGSGSHASHVAQGRGASFAAEEEGFAALHYYTDGSVWLEFWAPEKAGDTGELLYHALLKEASRPAVAAASTPDEEGGRTPPHASEERTGTALSDGGEPPSSDRETPAALMPSEPNAGEKPYAFADAAARAPYAFFTQGTARVSAARHYQVGPLKAWILGEHYRDVWAAPVDVPVIDLDRTAGGLTPIKKGGGLQTRSLRLQAGDGDQYVLRSVDKDPTQSIPVYLRRTIAHDVVRDQISAMFPYGAFLLPKMAEAAGMLHTYPLLVYVPDDERLGIYREEFGGTLALFEIRPDEDQSDEARFGFAENVVGWRKMEEKLAEDNENRVDERAFARARLFDMLIGDWDRHKDQWRWAEFEDEIGSLYKPVPRDRDFAFFKFDGLLSHLGKLTGDPAFRRFTRFGPEYGDLFGLNFNGATLDRRYTSSLTKADWAEIADSLRASLPDDVIEAAVRMLPDSIFARSGEYLTASLKARRDDLPAAAAAYYELLARIVDVVGSNKHERFEVTQLNDREVEVVVYKTKKEGDLVLELFRRTFKKSETKEIRLYGLDGQDRFVFGLERDAPVRIRAIGGRDEDVFTDSVRASGGSRNLFLYDTEAGTQWSVGPRSRLYRSNDPANDAYVPLRFELQTVAPRSFFSWNTDDGLFLGGGLRILKPGFRKTPFAARHEVAANFAVRTQTYNAVYRGTYTALVGPWDGGLEARVLAIRNFRNFYGLGNETEESEAVRESYQARIGRVFIEPALQKHLPLPFTRVSFGPRFEYTIVEPPRGWTEDDPRSAFDPEDFTDKYFLGAQAAFTVDGTDTLAATRFGARWLNRASLDVDVRSADNVLARLSSELSYFYTYDLPKTVTLALRAGGAVNIGDFEFYQASFLGGQNNLRGYRHNRFAGRSVFYTNAELRATLFDFNAYLTRGEAGLFAFLDNGRVWADGEDSGKWHQGYGGGFFLTPFYKVVLTGTLGFSPEGMLFNLATGFIF